MMNSSANMTTILIKIIKNDIINGVYQPGNRLLPLRELALKYNVSRSVVNSVISSLSAQGYVSVSPRHYVIVNDFLITGSLNILNDVLDSQNTMIKLKLLKDVLSYRKNIETEAIQYIIKNSNHDLNDLSEIIDEHRQWIKNPVNDLDLLVKLDIAFHRILLSSTGNVVHRLIFRHFESFSMKMVSYYYQNYNLAAQNFELYIEAFEAIKRQDEISAISSLSKVLDQGATYVLRLMK